MRSFSFFLFFFCCLVHGLEPAEVWSLQLPGLYEDGAHDAELILYQREGRVINGYLLTPTRDNLVHQVDATPAQPSVWVDRGGQPLEIPKPMKNRYGYKNKIFPVWKKKYEDGEIDLKQDPKEYLEITDTGIVGLVDVRFLGVDSPRSSSRDSVVMRMRFDLNLAGNRATGTAEVWPYREGDLLFGKGSPTRTLKVRGSKVDDHWEAKADQSFAPGTEWPMAHGPSLTGSAADFEGELVKNLHDARLVWVAEDPLTSGRGSLKSRGDFSMFPNNWKFYGFGGYGGPIVADHKVFVHVHFPNEEAVLADERLEQDAYVRQGLDPRGLGIEYGKMQDTIFCYEASSGRKLWEYRGPTQALSRFSKQGMASTPCYYKGKLYVRGMSGLYCFDADTGALIWRKGKASGTPLGIGQAPPEGSVVALKDTLILMNRLQNRTQTLGLDPESGELKWILNNAGGGNVGLPGLIDYQGKTCIALPRSPFIPGKRDKDKTPVPESFVIVNPENGEILLESDALGNAGGQLLVHDNMILGNWVKDLAGAKEKAKRNAEVTRLGAARLEGDTAESAWKQEDIIFKQRRQLGLLHRGIAYSSSRPSGFVAVDVTSGEVLARQQHVYAYSQINGDCVWFLGMKDRIITDGLIQWTTGDEGLRPLPGRLDMDVAGGYAAPNLPALSDGRIILRLSGKLACFDLRLPKDYNTEVIELTAEDALLGTTPEKDSISLRIRTQDGELLSVGAKETRSPTSVYQATLPQGLSLSEDSLRGDLLLRAVRNHFEPWTLDLTREGNSFSGTYTRRALPVPKPLQATGDIDGHTKEAGNGQKEIFLYIKNAVTSAEGIAADKVHGHLSLFLITKGDSISHAWARAGKVNNGTYEVDFSDLTLSGDTLSGAFTVLMRDDKSYDLNPPEGSTVRSGKGGLLCTRHEIEATRTGEAWKGTHDSLLGIAWEKTGRMTGTLTPDMGQDHAATAVP